MHLLQRHPDAAARAAAADDDAKRLRQLLAATKRRPREGDPLADADLDAEFHMAIAEASHNAALVHATRGLFNLMRSNMYRAREVLYWQADNVALLDAQHEDVVKAIVAGDQDRARAAANLHLSFIQASLCASAADGGAKPRRARTAQAASAASAVR